MAGYLSESDFVMVEEGFSTRDLLEELTLGAPRAATVRAWEWRWALNPSSGRALILFFHLLAIQSTLFSRDWLILSLILASLLPLALPYPLP